MASTTTECQSPLAAHAAAQLPDLSAAALGACLRPKALPLSSCLHLSNPASGSTSLSNHFKHDERFRNLTFPHASTALPRADIFPSGTGIQGFDLMHTHAFGISEYQSYLRHKKLPEARCFVLPIRDPATRLMSAFRDSYVHAERMTASLGARKNRTATELVRRLRQFRDLPQRPLALVPSPAGTDGASASAGCAEPNRNAPARNASFAAYLYAHSAGLPKWLYNWHYPGPVGGSQFLTSQLHYLRGVDCRTAEVHFLCQERFDEDWAAFLASKRSVPGSSDASATAHSERYHSHRRDAASSGHSPLMKFALRRAVLSEADQDYVRQVLYPWDAALHRWACAPRPAAAASRAREAEGGAMLSFVSRHHTRGGRRHTRKGDTAAGAAARGGAS